MSEWISVETLPETDYPVLIIGNDCFTVAMYDGDGDWECAESGELIDWVPSHWMPLPEPPNA